MHIIYVEMNLRFTRSLFLFCVVLSLAIVSCEDELEIASSPGEISMHLDVPQGTRINAEFPRPSEDPLAPVLKEETDTIYIIYASYKNIFVTLMAGEAKGFNLQVMGSGDYFNITSTKALVNHPGGNVFGFSLITQDNIKPRAFNIAYSVYDAEGRVSNIVERTIVISDRGGKNSAFLSGKIWSTKEEIRGIGEASDTLVIGQSDAFEYSTVLNCYGEPNKTVDVVNEYRVDYERYTFSSGGKITIEVATYQKRFDQLESTNSCSLQYEIVERTGKLEGIWSYHSDSKRLILLYNRIGADEQGNKVVYPDELFEYDIVGDAHSMTWKSAGKDVPVTVTFH